LHFYPNSNIVKDEDRLIGATNFNAWKYRIINILEENDLEDYITREIEEPTTNTARAAYKRKQTKAKRIIFDSIKDNMMPLIGHLRTAKECLMLWQISMRRRHLLRRES
jgi:hypothetical protein